MYFVVQHKGKNVILQSNTLAELEEKCATLCAAPRNKISVFHNDAHMTSDVFASLEGRASAEFAMIEVRMLTIEPEMTEHKKERITAQATSNHEVADASSLSSMIAAADARRRMEQSFENRKEIARQEAAAADRLIAKSADTNPSTPVRDGRRDSRAPAPQLQAAADTASKFSRAAADPLSNEFTSCSVQDDTVRKQLPPHRPDRRELITASDIVRCSSFVDLRLDALSRMSADGIDFQASCYLHFIRRDTKELVVTAAEYDTLRAVILKRRDANHWSDDEVVMEWRLDNQPLQQSQPSDARPRDASSPLPRTFIGSPHVTAITPTVTSAPRLRGQVKLVIQTQGTVGYVPFDRHYPPSYWMLLQHVSHITGIPANYLEIDVLSDFVNEVMIVQSDADVRAVCCLMDRGDPTLFAVDLRL